MRPGEAGPASLSKSGDSAIVQKKTRAIIVMLKVGIFGARSASPAVGGAGLEGSLTGLGIILSPIASSPLAVTGEVSAMRMPAQGRSPSA
jgi:hypothetical protein